jgi:adenine-specific DNA-methyltransferase
MTEPLAPPGRLVADAHPEAPHRFIEGDNLAVAGLLLPALAGAARLIYLDPPYNTGTRMRYPDRFGRGATGHAAWRAMMAPRLAAARELLAPEGAIFVSIDDRETHHLRVLMDDVFGEDNFVATIVWRKKVVRGRGARHVLPQTEYIHIYARDLKRLPAFSEPLTASMRGEYRQADAQGPYKRIPLAKSGTAQSARPNLLYAIEAPDGTMIPCPTHQWRWSRETLAARMDEIEFLKGRDGAWRVYTKQRLAVAGGERGRTPESYWDRATTTDGTAELHAHFGRPVIDFPKPLRLIEDILTWACPPDGLVVDLFAGTCPTAEAVLRLNARDGGTRRFLCVQAPEPLDGDPDFATIADVARARLAKVQAGLGAEAPAIGLWRWEAVSVAD